MILLLAVAPLAIPQVLAQCAPLVRALGLSGLLLRAPPGLCAPLSQVVQFPILALRVQRGPLPELSPEALAT